MQITNHPIYFSYEKGPFDIIGDIHGCAEELKLLLKELGYQIISKNGYAVAHSQGRKVIFVGDLVE